MTEFSSGVGPNDLTPAAWRLSQADNWTAYYGGPGSDVVSSTGIPNNIDQIQFVPFYSGFGGQVSEIAFNVTVAGGAGSKCRAGLYVADQRTLMPTDLVVDGGEYDTTITGFKNTILSPQVVLPPGELFFLAFLPGTSAPTVTTFTSGWHMFGRSATLNAQSGRIKTNFPYGPLPQQAGTVTGVLTTNACLVALRFATVGRPHRTN